MNLVNKPLYENSAYTFNHAYYFDLDTVSIAAANRPQTEYNLSVATRELSIIAPWTPVEEIFTGKQYIDTHTTKYTKNDLYTKVLPKVLTWASKNYYWIKARFSQTGYDYKLTLPVDPTPTGLTTWVAGDSLKYGVYSSIVTYPGLDYSAESSHNVYRNLVFTSVKT